MSKNIDSRDQVRRLQVVSAGVFIALAVGAGVFMNDTTYQVTLGHLAKDALASQGGGTVLAPASSHLFDVSLKSALIGILGISALIEVLALTKWRTRYLDALKKGVIGGRWIKLAITWGLMMEVIALVSGVHDLFVLKLMGGLIASTALLGWIGERQNNDVKKPIWSAFGLSIYTGILSWMLLVASAVGTVVYGMERSVWYVYALHASLLLPAILLAVNQYRAYRRRGSWKNYAFIERNYVAIDLLAKTAFAAILIFSFRR